MCNHIATCVSPAVNVHNSHKTYQWAVDEMTLPLAPSCLKNFGRRRTLQNHTKLVFSIKEEEPWHCQNLKLFFSNFPVVYSLYCISHCLLTVQSVPPYCLKGKILHDRYSWRQWAFEKLLTVPSVFGKRNVWFIMSMMSLIPPCHPTHVQNNVKRHWKIWSQPEGFWRIDASKKRTWVKLPACL